MNTRRIALLFVCFSSLSTWFIYPASAEWKYYRSGNGADKDVTPVAGFALMGGGPKQEVAFRFLCERANGGDFLLLRAFSDESYAQEVNREIQGLCSLNSVATIVFSDRDDSNDPKIIEIIDHAESIFIAGGDQSNYLRFWQDTPVQEALNRHIAAGKPIGGSSAGLAVLGQFSFASMIDTIYSPEALANPYGNKVTLARDFLQIPILKGVITDSHFVKRDRMGRLLVFLARILQDGWAKSAKAIAVDENGAVLLEPDGRALVIGEPAYFLNARKRPKACSYRTALKIDGVSVHRTPPRSTFNLKSWKGQGDDYELSAIGGETKSSSSSGQIY